MSTAIKVGLDAAIARTNERLTSKLNWLGKAYGRAFLINERQPDGSARRTPKVYGTKGEYMNVFPSDLEGMAFSFFWPISAEEPVDEQQGFFSTQVGKTREVALIIFCNLKEIYPTHDDVYTEILKRDVERVLGACPDVEQILRYEDEDIEKVYRGFDLDENARYRNAGNNVTQWLMYPYAGMRWELKMSYRDEC